MLDAAAEQNEATLHKNVLIHPTLRTPNRSSNTPDGSCIAAYVQLYALSKYPKVMVLTPNASCSACCETEILTRSRKFPNTPNPSNEAISQRRRGTARWSASNSRCARS